MHVCVCACVHACVHACVYVRMRMCVDKDVCIVLVDWFRCVSVYVCSVCVSKQVIRVQKLPRLLPLHSNYLGIFLRFISTLAKVITFIKTIVLKF